MPRPVVDAFILLMLAVFVVPNLGLRGRLRRLFELAFKPFVWLGLWYRWSMYSPEVPRATQLGLVGVRFADGRFEVVPLPGLDDDRGFGKARNLRFIAFQWALCDPATDPLRPGLADEALRRWRADRAPGESQPVAVELREYRYPSPPPGQRDGGAQPEVRTLWSRAVEER